MNIWLIQDGDPLPSVDIGDREMRCCTLAKALASKGHNVLWWASTFDHFRKRHRFPGPVTIDVLPNFHIRLLHGPGYPANQSFKRFIHQRAIARAFAAEAASVAPPDLIVGNIPFPELAEQAVILGKKWSIPTVVYVEDCWPDIYLSVFPAVLRGLGRFLFRSEFKRITKVFSLASSIVAVSNTYLNWALKYSGRSRGNADRVFPLGYPVPIENVDKSKGQAILSELGISLDKILITFVGGFGFSYDLETIVRAAQVLGSRGVNDVQFLLVGDGDQGPHLRAMAQGSENIKFTGWLDQNAIQSILGVSSVALASYHERATQTLPNKPFEYMAAGLPILSSLNGELRELIESEGIGIYYKSGDVDSLIAAVSSLIARPEARLDMGKKARRLFDDRYSAEVIYPKIVRHLESLIPT